MNHCIPSHLWSRYKRRRSVWESSIDQSRFRHLYKPRPEWGGATVEYILSMPEEWRQRFWMAGFTHIEYMKMSEKAA